MKKLIPLLLPVLIAVLLLVGCSVCRAPSAEGTWQLITVQQEDGTSIACRPGTPGMPEDAAPVQLVLRIEDGVLSLLEADTPLCTGSYRQTRASAQARQMYITLGDQEGIGTLAWTRWADGSSLPTLLLSIGGYTLTFMASN